MEINKTYIYNGQPLGQKRTMKPVRPNRSGLLGYLQNLNSGEFWLMLSLIYMLY